MLRSPRAWSLENRAQLELGTGTSRVRKGVEVRGGNSKATSKVKCINLGLSVLRDTIKRFPAFNGALRFTLACAQSHMSCIMGKKGRGMTDLSPFVSVKRAHTTSVPLYNAKCKFVYPTQARQR